MVLILIPDRREAGKKVDVNGFLRHEILIVDGTPQTIKDVILFAAMRQAASTPRLIPGSGKS
jgi:hypothetical protein